MTDFSAPQRMSRGSFLIMFLKFFRLTINVTVIFLIYEIVTSECGFAESLQKTAAVLCCTIALALILASLTFFNTKFHVEGGNLIYRRHIISRSTTTIPLDRIHSLRTRQGILYRILDLRGVLFDTLATKGEEIELILSESDWQSLLKRVELQEHPQTIATGIPPCSNPSSFLKFSDKDLLLDALCQNHLKGMVILGGLVAVIFNTLSDLPENAIKTIVNYLEPHIGHFSVSVAGIALIMIFTYMVSLLLWIGKILLRYYDLSLTYDNKTLTFSHGLFSRMSSRFARDKICTLRIKRNYFEKRFGLCTLSLKQALNASSQDEDNLIIYGHDCSRFFLDWWFGQDYGSNADIATAKSGKGVIIYSLLPDLLLSFVAAVVLWHIELYSWIAIPVIYLLAGIPKGILTMRHSYISLKESYLIIGNGSLAEIKNYLRYENIEVVRITRTPMSRFTGRVSLTLSTSGTTFTIRSISRRQAIHIYDLLLSKTTACTSTATE